jgi:hypothetical protein
MAPARVQPVARRKKLNKSLSSTSEQRATAGPALHSKQTFASARGSLKCSRALLACATLRLCKTLSGTQQRRVTGGAGPATGISKAEVVDIQGEVVVRAESYARDWVRFNERHGGHSKPV